MKTYKEEIGRIVLIVLLIAGIVLAGINIVSFYKSSDAQAENLRKYVAEKLSN